MSKRMTKKEIVKTISEELGLTQLKTKEIVQRTFNAIIEALTSEPDFENEKGIVNRIELRNFGVFEVKKRAARNARNPKTGDPVFVPEKFVVTFKPGKEMEQQVQSLEEKNKREQRLNESRVPPPAVSRPIPPVPPPSNPAIMPVNPDTDSSATENSGS